MAVDIPIRYTRDTQALKESVEHWRKIQRELGITDSQVKKVEKSTKDLEQETKKTSVGFENIGKAIAAYFAFDQIAAFTKEVIRVRGEFQKFEAVLTNTLGSRGLARQALNDISNFAAKTPFQVDAITGAFVKLANQGFVPTIDEMTKLGDLASSTGKDFDMLAEAIIDAQTGEFERLKEFGIRASKEGNNVTFTFKGVQTQAAFTADAIRDYVLSLGEAEGVSGSMAAISETLEGKVSMLTDAWTNFMNKLGEMIEGPGAGTIDFLTDAINLAGKFIEIINRVESDPTLITAGLNSAAGEQLKNIEDLVERLNTLRHDMTGPMFPGERRTAEAEEQEILALLRKQSEELSKQYALDQKRKKEAEDAKKLTQDQINQISLYRKLVDSTRSFDTALGVSEIKKLETAIIKAEREARLLANTLTKLEADPADKMKRSLAELEEEIRTLGVGPLELGSVTQAFEDAEKLRTKKLKEQKEEREKLYKEEQETRARLEQEAYNLFFELTNAAMAVSYARTQKEIEDVEATEAYKLSLVGDNEDAQEQIRAETARKKKEIQAREARRTKDIATFEAIVHTASAVAEALPNYVLAAIVGAAGLVQVAAIQSQPIPRYKKGVKGVPGVDRGEDSVLAMLRPKEWVFPVETVNDYQPALGAIFDRKIAPEVMNAIAMGVRPSGSGPAINPKDLELAMGRALEKVPFHNVHVDKQGFHDYVKSLGMEVQKDINEFKF